MYWRCTSIKIFSAGPALKYFEIINRAGRTACGQRRSPFECKFSTVAVNSKPLLRASKLDCTLVTFKFNNRKITPKTTLNKHWCLFRVVFSVFFWSLNLNITKILYYRWNPLQSAVDKHRTHKVLYTCFLLLLQHNMLKYYYYYTMYPNTTIMTQYSKILLLSHNMLKYFYHNMLKYF